MLLHGLTTILIVLTNIWKTIEIDKHLEDDRDLQFAMLENFSITNTSTRFLAEWYTE